SAGPGPVHRLSELMSVAAPSRRGPAWTWRVTVVAALAALAACSDPAAPAAAGLDSRSLRSPEERLAELGRHVRLRSPARDAEFVIVKRDGSRGLVPGPSHWDIRVAVEIAPGDAAAWHEGWAPCHPDEDGSAWSRELLARR